MAGEGSLSLICAVPSPHHHCWPQNVPGSGSLPCPASCCHPQPSSLAGSPHPCLQPRSLTSFLSFLLHPGPVHLALLATWEHPRHHDVFLPPRPSLPPSAARSLGSSFGAPLARCERAQAARPRCQQGAEGRLSLPAPAHLPWAELALEVAQSSPIASGACLCSPGRRINYQGCGAVDHSSYYFLLLQIGVVESSVPFNPHSSVYFPAGSTNAAFPITSQRASDRSLRKKKRKKKKCCNCLFFSIFKHF